MYPSLSSQRLSLDNNIKLYVPIVGTLYIWLYIVPHFSASYLTTLQMGLVETYTRVTPNMPQTFSTHSLASLDNVLLRYLRVSFP